jgi:hypothetical protein
VLYYRETRCIIGERNHRERERQDEVKAESDKDKVSSSGAEPPTFSFTLPFVLQVKGTLASNCVRGEECHGVVVALLIVERFEEMKDEEKEEKRRKRNGAEKKFWRENANLKNPLSLSLCLSVPCLYLVSFAVAVF